MTLYFIIGYAAGFFNAAVFLTPDTPFWRGFRDGAALMPLWRLIRRAWR